MNRHLAIVGMVISVVYLALAVWLVGDRLPALKSMDLNAVGDFFAGIFGPLSILWLVLGFFQQGMELRQNNEALRLQAEELKNSVEQQRELVVLAREQFAAELNAIQEDRRQRLAALEPIFSFDKLNLMSVSGGASYFGGDIFNAGNKVVDVAISSGCDDIIFSSERFSSFMHGDSVRLRFKVKSNCVPQSFDLRFSYRIDNGDSRVKCFFMVLVCNGKNEIEYFERSEVL